MRDLYNALFVKSRMCVFILSITFMLAFFNNPAAASTDCTANLQNANSWQLEDIASNSKIIWQKTETNISVGDDNLDMLNLYHGLATSEQYVLLWQDTYNSCNAQLVMLDRQTGIELGNLDADKLKFFRGVYNIDSGYIVTTDHSVTKYNDTNKEIWQNSDLPPKSIRAVYQNQSKLYLPSRSVVYVLSSDNGFTETTISVAHLLAYFDKYVAKANSQGTAIELFDLEQQIVVSNIELTDISHLQNAFTFLWRNTDRAGEVLLVYYVRGRVPERNPRVDAFDVHTGKLIWTISYPFIGVPIVLNEKLIMYTSEGLRIFSVKDGKLLSRIRLTRQGQSYVPKNVWLSGYDDTILISYRDQRELVALKLGELK